MIDAIKYTGDYPNLIKQLQSCHDEHQFGKCVRMFVDKSSLHDYAENDIIVKLSNSLSSKEEAVLAAHVLLLGALFKSSLNSVNLAKTNAIEKTISFLSSHCETLRDDSKILISEGLKWICENKHGLKQMAIHKAHQPLLLLLKCESREVRLAVLHALAALTKTCRCLAVIHEDLPGEEFFTPILSDSDPQMRLAFLKLVICLLQAPQTRKRMSWVKSALVKQMEELKEDEKELLFPLRIAVGLFIAAENFESKLS